MNMPSISFNLLVLLGGAFKARKPECIVAVKNAPSAYRDPVREVLFDMTWNYQHWYRQQSSSLHEQIMDSFSGSRGMFDWLNEESEKFQSYWVALPKDSPAQDNYYDEVDEWVSKAIEVLRVRLRLEASAGPTEVKFS